MRTKPIILENITLVSDQFENMILTNLHSRVVFNENR